MVQDRGLERHRLLFGQAFLDTLASSREWFELGSGEEAVAARQYLASGGKAHVTAISRRFTNEAKKIPRLLTIEGYFENIEKSKIPKSFDTGTDCMGILTYVKDLRGYLEDITGRMHPSSRLFIETYGVNTTIKVRKKHGSGFDELTLFDWLDRQKNIDAKLIKMNPPYITYAVSIIGPVRLPKLSLISYAPGIPPRRVYEQK
jgi:hypothetical protein